MISTAPTKPSVAFSYTGSKAIHLVHLTASDITGMALPLVFNPEYEPEIQMSETDQIMMLHWSQDGDFVMCLTNQGHLFSVTR